MDALLTGIPWSGLGWGGLIFAAVLALIRGDLVPRRTHDSIVSTYQEATDAERQASSELRAALRLIAEEYGTTADKVLSALPVPEDGDDA